MESPREPQAVRVLAALYFATYWLIIFTGAIRKWMFPGAQILYLLQDVPLVIAYLTALWTGMFSRQLLMMGMVCLSALLLLQGMLQIVFSGLSTFIVGVGLHHYLFYLPMLLVFPICLTEKYRQDFVRWNLLLSIPMCALAILQNKAPKAALINRTTEGEAFGLPGTDVARVSGTFNFIAFYAVWAGMLAALCVGEWLLPKHKRAIKKLWLLLLCSGTVNICVLVSGSRTAIALAGLGVVGAMVAAIALGSTRAIASVAAVIVLVPLCGAATYVISPDEYNIVMERFTGQHYVSDNKRRLEEGTIGFLTEPKFSLIGAGIGMGVDAAHAGSADAYNFTYGLSETDIIRNVMELGSLVGLIYVFTRLLFFLGLILLAYRLVRTGSSPHVLPLSFFLFAQAYQGDLTRNAAITGSMVMTAVVYILGAYYNPDTSASLEDEADALTTRSV